jgi:hypothetical protein
MTFHRTSHLMADTWSMSYEFEQIEITEDGIQFGSFSGVAELAINDPRDGDFVVKCLAIEGTKRERQTLNGYRLSIMKTRDAVLLIRRPASEDRTFKAHLFRAIETALYASEHARECFASELEDA